MRSYKVDAGDRHADADGSVPTEKQPRAFEIDPTGQYLYAVGEKSDSMTSYAIDGQTGKLEKLKQYPVGKNPNWIEIVSLAVERRDFRTGASSCGRGELLNRSVTYGQSRSINGRKLRHRVSPLAVHPGTVDRGPTILRCRSSPGQSSLLADALILLMKVMAMHGIIKPEAIDTVFTDLENRYRGAEAPYRRRDGGISAPSCDRVRRGHDPAAAAYADRRVAGRLGLNHEAVNGDQRIDA